MIVDTSAVVAVMLGEPGYERYQEAIACALRPRMSAISLYEAATVLLIRKGRSAVRLLSEYVEESGITIVDFGSADAVLATEVYGRFGKGSSPAGLNLGDCPVLALADKHNQPVLSTSAEFARAGARSALPV